MSRIVVTIGRVELAPVKATKRIEIQVLDDNEAAVDPTDLTLTITDRASTDVRVDTYGAVGSRIVRTAVGRFYFPLGGVVPNDETDQRRDYVFYWNATVGGAQVSALEAVRVATSRFFWALTALRLYLDKSFKPIEEDTPLGFTDGMLALWLDAGLQMINAAQPYPMWEAVDDFPDVHLQLLIDSAAVTGLTSQALFAVDTDIPNYTEQGTSFPLDHHPRLLASLQAIAQRLDAYVPLMKRHYVSSGGLHVQMSPNFRIAMLANSAPGGALFRNLFVAKL